MCEHIIGLVYDYEGATLATYDWLKRQHEDDLRSVQHFRDNPEQDICGGIYLESAAKRAESSSLPKLFDKSNGRMTRFDFCPNCGKKNRLESIAKTGNIINRTNRPKRAVFLCLKGGSDLRMN